MQPPTAPLLVLEDSFAFNAKDSLCRAAAVPQVLLPAQASPISPEGVALISEPETKVGCSSEAMSHCLSTALLINSSPAFSTQVLFDRPTAAPSPLPPPLFSDVDAAAIDAVIAFQSDDAPAFAPALQPALDAAAGCPLALPDADIAAAMPARHSLFAPPSPTPPDMPREPQSPPPSTVEGFPPPPMPGSSALTLSTSLFYTRFGCDSLANGDSSNHELGGVGHVSMLSPPRPLQLVVDTTPFRIPRRQRPVATREVLRALAESPPLGGDTDDADAPGVPLRPPDGDSAADAATVLVDVDEFPQSSSAGSRPPSNATAFTAATPTTATTAPATLRATSSASSSIYAHSTDAWSATVLAAPSATFSRAGSTCTPHDSGERLSGFDEGTAVTVLNGDIAAASVSAPDARSASVLVPNTGDRELLPGKSLSSPFGPPATPQPSSPVPLAAWLGANCKLDPKPDETGTTCTEYDEGGKGARDDDDVSTVDMPSEAGRRRRRRPVVRVIDLAAAFER